MLRASYEAAIPNVILVLEKSRLKSFSLSKSSEITPLTRAKGLMATHWDLGRSQSFHFLLQ